MSSNVGFDLQPSTDKLTGIYLVYTTRLRHPMAHANGICRPHLPLLLSVCIHDPCEFLLDGLHANGTARLSPIQSVFLFPLKKTFL